MTLSRAAVSAAVLAAGLAFGSSASLAGHHCKADKEGEAKVLGVGPGAANAATHHAIRAWKHKVAAKYGWEYARWSRAAEKAVRCDVERGSTECEVEAKPCL